MNIFNRIININIYVLVFLVPLFFLPFSFEAFEFNKQYLLFFLVSLAFFAWLAKMALVDKELRFKRTPLDLFVLGFLVVGILSTVFSVDKTSSLYGFYGRFNNGLLGLLSLGILYFVMTNNLEAKRVASLLKTFLWSGFIAVLLSYLAIFGVLAKLTLLPRVMQQIIFNPTSASLEGFSVFLAVLATLLVGLMLVRTDKGKIKSISHWVILTAILGLMVLIDFTAAWLVLLVTLILFVALSLWKRIFRLNVNRLLIPIFLILIATACIPFQSQGIITNLPREQVLNQGTSWGIGLRSSLNDVKSGFLGSGMGTFHYDFAKEKPLSFNQNWLWQIRFDRAGTHLAEVLATMGFLGILSYLIIIGLFLMLSYFMLQKVESALPLLMVSVALLVGQFLYYQNNTLALLFWLSLAMSVVSWQKPIKEKVVSFKDFPELNLVFSTMVIIVGVAILGIYFYAAKFYLADINYAQAQRTAISAERTVALERAVRLNPGLSQYRAILARAYMNEALAEMQKPQAEQDAAKTQIFVATAINQARIATELGPNQVANWETLAMVYREIRSVASGAVDWGIKSFERAISLEPTNPVVYTELGKLYVLTNNIEKAREEFSLALAKKPDYTDALIQDALLLEREGDTQGAIRQMESLVVNYPFSTEIIFQLGRLYFNNNQITLAIEQFKRVVILLPDHSNAHYSLGVAYAAKGETNLALLEFEKVLELNPGNQDVIKKLEQLRE